MSNIRAPAKRGRAPWSKGTRDIFLARAKDNFLAADTTPKRVAFSNWTALAYHLMYGHVAVTEEPLGPGIVPDWPSDDAVKAHEKSLNDTLVGLSDDEVAKRNSDREALRKKILVWYDRVYKRASKADEDIVAEVIKPPTISKPRKLQPIHMFTNLYWPSLSAKVEAAYNAQIDASRAAYEAAIRAGDTDPGRQDVIRLVVQNKVVSDEFAKASAAVLAEVSMAIEEKYSSELAAYHNAQQPSVKDTEKYQQALEQGIGGLQKICDRISANFGMCATIIIAGPKQGAIHAQSVHSGKTVRGGQTWAEDNRDAVRSVHKLAAAHAVKCYTESNFLASDKAGKEHELDDDDDDSTPLSQLIPISRPATARPTSSRTVSTPSRRPSPISVNKQPTTADRLSKLPHVAAMLQHLTPSGRDLLTTELFKLSAYEHEREENICRNFSVLASINNDTNSLVKVPSFPSTGLFAKYARYAIPSPALAPAAPPAEQPAPAPSTTVSTSSVDEHLPSRQHTPSLPSREPTPVPPSRQPTPPIPSRSPTPAPAEQPSTPSEQPSTPSEQQQHHSPVTPPPPSSHNPPAPVQRSPSPPAPKGGEHLVYNPNDDEEVQMDISSLDWDAVDMSGWSKELRTSFVGFSRARALPGLYGAAMTRLYDDLVTFQRHKGFPDTGTAFGKPLRPKEVAGWMARGRQWGKKVVVDDIVVFASSWWSWWKDAQPVERIAEDGRLMKPGRISWDVLETRTSTNGFIVVAATLLWWGEALFEEAPSLVGDGSYCPSIDEARADWVLAVQDVVWVLEHLVSDTNSVRAPAAKHASPADLPRTRRSHLEDSSAVPATVSGTSTRQRRARRTSTSKQDPPPPPSKRRRV